MANKKAFTLVELLVVISIIALLLAMLMPALNQAKEQAKLVVCRNNNHQIGLALFVYADGNKGNLPTDNWDSGDTWMCTCRQPDGHVRGFGLLDPVYKLKTDGHGAQPVNKWLVCPSDRMLARYYNKMDQSGIYGRFVDSGGNVLLEEGGISYINDCLPLAQYTPGIGRFAGYYTRNAVGWRPRDKVGLPQASRAMVTKCSWMHGTKEAKDAANGPGSHPWWPQGVPPDKRPRELGTAALFLDGHVVTCTFSKYAAAFRKANNLPGTHLLPWNEQLSLQIQTGGSFDRNNPSNDTTTWTEALDLIGG